jgi:hypothetical protein
VIKAVHVARRECADVLVEATREEADAEGQHFGDAFHGVDYTPAGLRLDKMGGDV